MKFFCVLKYQVMMIISVFQRIISTFSKYYPWIPSNLVKEFPQRHFNMRGP